MLTTEWHLYSGIIIQGLAVLTQLTVIIFYIYQSKSKNQMATVNESKKMEILNILTLFVLLLSTTCWLLNYCGLFNYLNIHCKYAFFLCYLLYLYYHGFMYCIYTARLHIVYNDTKFELSKCTKISLWLIIITYFIIYTLIVVFENFLKNVAFPIEFPNIWSICWGEPSSILIVIGFIIIESIFPTITMILFIKPLWILYNKHKETNDDRSKKRRKDQSLLKLSTKYTFLTLITIISSTAASIGHIFLEIIFIAGVSVLINALAIILYEDKFAMYYKLLIKFMCYPCYVIWKKNEPVRELAHLQSVESKSPTSRTQMTRQATHDQSVCSQTQTRPTRVQSVDSAVSIN